MTEENVVKQAAQKKPKTFRTLIRQTNNENRKLQDKDRNVDIVDNRVKQVDNPEKRTEKTATFFFRTVNQPSVRMQGAFLFYGLEREERGQ